MKGEWKKQERGTSSGLLEAFQVPQSGRHCLVGLDQHFDEVRGLVEVLGGEEGVRSASPVTPRRPADPVHVVLAGAGVVEVDHVLHVRDVCNANREVQPIITSQLIQK